MARLAQKSAVLDRFQHKSLSATRPVVLNHSETSHLHASRCASLELRAAAAHGEPLQNRDAHDTMATPPAPPKSNTRRDALLKLEAQVQQQWENEGTFEADAQEGRPKFFVTFPS